jgi:PKD repeat protein
MTIVSHSVNFNGTPTSGAVPLFVSFTNLSSTISGTLTASAWTFGDGGTSSVFSPTYTYNTPGTYTVTLVQSYSAFADATATKTNYITVTGATSYGGGNHSGVNLRGIKLGT